MSLTALLRMGSFYRVFVGMLALSWAFVAALKGGWPAFALAVPASMLTSAAVAWWTGRRVARTIDEWRHIAVLAGREDFSATVDGDVPYLLQPLRGSLIDARRLLAESLTRAREEKALLVSMLNAMTEGVIAVDAKGRILLVNRLALTIFGIAATESPERFEGQMLVQLVRDPRLNELVDKVLATGRPMRDETEILASRKLVDLSVAPITENGRVRGVVAAIADETTLRQLERVRQDFVTNVSHELKTPIAAIRGWAETLISGIIDVPDELMEPLETIHRQSERLSGLVDDLMVLARVETTGAGASGDRVDMEEVVDSVELALDELIVGKSIRLEVMLDDAARWFPASARSMEYILRNLVDNAVKYTDAGGEVTIRTSAPDSSTVALEVSDTGRGIEPHHLARIFERFYRVDSGRSRDLGGTGLGLAIVKNFVTSLGGQVLVESEVGEGTTFRVVLPVKAEKPR